LKLPLNQTTQKKINRHKYSKTKIFNLRRKYLNGMYSESHDETDTNIKLAINWIDQI